MRRTMFPGSIFIRLILTFLAVVVPLYGLGTQVYTWANEVVKKGITNSAGSQVDFYLESLNKDIDRMITIQYDLMIDEDLNQLAAIPESLNDIEMMKAILRLQKRLMTIRGSNDLIQDVFLYIPSINKTIQSNGVNGLNTSDMNTLLNQWLNAGTKLVFLHHEAALVTQKLNKMGNPTFVMAIIISEYKIKEQLSLLEQNQDSGLLMTDLNGSLYLSTADDPALIENLRQFASIPTGNSSPDGTEYAMNGSEYIIMNARSDKLAIKLYKYILKDDIFTELQHYRYWFWLFTGLAVVLILMFSLTTYRLIKRPLGKLTRAFRRLEEGDLDIQIEYHHRKDEFNFLYSRFNLMVNRLKQMMEQVYMQRILAQRSELMHLQSQINPHFLYNSFFILSNMVESEDNDNAKAFSRQLGEYLRFVTRNASAEVLLAHEVQHARTYAELQARRYRKRIELAFAPLPDDWGHVFVPRLIIQPIIENAFEHGLANKMENGKICITFEIVEGAQPELMIIIEDNGEELTVDRLQELQYKLNSSSSELEVTGLVNVHQRLRFKFGDLYGLEAVAGQSGGLRVSMKISTGV